MLWKPATHGEDLFLRLHDGLGGRIELKGPTDCELGFLITEQHFVEYVQLAATFEVFMRSIRTLRDFYKGNETSHSSAFGKALRNEIGLPSRLSQDQQFCEVAKQTGEVICHARRSEAIERNAIRTAQSHCYMCGKPLIKSKTPHKDRLSYEHLWPLSLGGQTIEENIVAGCQFCNNSRKHTVTWAAGPVVETYFHTEDTWPFSLRLSLALARLTNATSRGGRKKTLKEALEDIRPLERKPPLQPSSHHLYFELLLSNQDAT